MGILTSVPDYNLVLDTTTSLFIVNPETISNPTCATTVFNSFGIAIDADSDVNGLLQLSAVDVLAGEESFTVVDPEAEETEDFTGNEGLNETLVDVVTFADTSSADTIINTLINEEVTTNMNVTLNLTVNSPVIKTEFNPRKRVLPTGVVKR